MDSVGRLVEMDSFEFVVADISSFKACSGDERSLRKNIAGPGRANRMAAEMRSDVRRPR